MELHPPCIAPGPRSWYDVLANVWRTGRKVIGEKNTGGKCFRVGEGVSTVPDPGPVPLGSPE